MSECVCACACVCVCVCVCVCGGMRRCAREGVRVIFFLVFCFVLFSVLSILVIFAGLGLKKTIQLKSRIYYFQRKPQRETHMKHLRK